MNKCESTIQIEAYHDNQLSDTDRAQVELHLAECMPCAEELSMLRRLSTKFAALPPIRLSQMALHRMHNNIDQMMDRSMLRFARMMTGIAALLLIGCCGWMMVANGQSQGGAIAVVAPGNNLAGNNLSTNNVSSIATEPILIAILDDSTNSSVSLADQSSAAEQVVQELLN